MLTRSLQETLGTPLPEEWLKEYQDIIDRTYLKLCEEKQVSVELFGRVYNTELLLGFTIRDNSPEKLAPYGLLLSFNVEKPEQIQEIKKDSLDLAAQFLDQFFFQNQREYIPNWSPEQYKKLNFFYKITREDFALSIQADELLS